MRFALALAGQAMTDRAFPQLRTALQPHLMRTLLRPAVQRAVDRGEFSGSIMACTVDEVRYVPGRSCVLTYKLLDEHSVEYWLTARLSLSGSSEVLPQRHPQPVATETLNVDGAMMHLWWFPSDRALVNLPALFNATQRQKLLLPALVSMGFEAGDRVQQTVPTVVHYLPERSCVIRYDMHWLPAAGGGTRKVGIYAKNYADETGGETYNTMQSLAKTWTGGAQALAYDATTRTLLQKAVPGRALSWDDMVSRDAEALVARMAHCVAALHTADVVCNRQHKVTSVFKDLDKTSKLAQHAAPDISKQIVAAIGRLKDRFGLVAGRDVSAVLHRDLKLLNFISDGSEVRLIDMDTVALGDPLVDLGSLGANLHMQALRAGRTDRAADAVCEQFVRAYKHQSGFEFSSEHWHWHIAAALLHEVVRRTLRQQDPARLACLRDVVAVCERYCLAL